MGTEEIGHVELIATTIARLTDSAPAHGTTTEGEVVEEITGDTEAAGRTVRASPEDPQYRVRSDKSGRDAVHRPAALDQT